MNQREKVFRMLDTLNIKYQVMDHKAVFTVEEMDSLNLLQHGDICKNLFLRDAKGDRHFLVVLSKDKKADLKSIQKQLECTRLSFASEESLYKYLHLHKGEVTPLAIINDPGGMVEIVLDTDLVEKDKLGFHPNDNTATVWISFTALKKIIEQNDNIVHFVNFRKDDD